MVNIVLFEVKLAINSCKLPHADNMPPYIRAVGGGIATPR